MKEPLPIISITSHLDSILRIFLKPLQPFQPHDANVRNERKMKEIGSLKKKIGPRTNRWRTDGTTMAEMEDCRKFVSMPMARAKKIKATKGGTRQLSRKTRVTLLEQMVTLYERYSMRIAYHDPSYFG